MERTGALSESQSESLELVRCPISETKNYLSVVLYFILEQTGGLTYVSLSHSNT